MGNCLCFKKRNDNNHEQKIVRNEIQSTISDEEHKKAGNELFRQGKIPEAIDEYSKAITINPTVSIYYSNRSLCYYKLKDYKNSCADSNLAFSIDNTNIKALILCAKSKALEALNGDFRNFEDSIIYCKELKIITLKKNESHVSYCKRLKRKIKSLYNYIKRKQEKKTLMKYYKQNLPFDVFIKLKKLAKQKTEIYESLQCPLTMVLFI